MKKALGLLMSAALTFSCANTLDQIKSANTIRIGVADHSAPFSKLNRDGEFEGFEVDLAKEIAKAILGPFLVFFLTNLNIFNVPNNITLIMNGIKYLFSNIFSL